MINACVIYSDIFSKALIMFAYMERYKEKDIFYFASPSQYFTLLTS